MKRLRYTFVVYVLLVSLISTACGSPPPATQEPVTGGATQPSVTTAPATSAPTQPAATQPQPTAKPVATATLDPTRKALDLSRTNQPGSTLAGSVVEQIVFGEDYDDKQNQIVGPAFVFSVAIPKVLFAFGVENGTQALSFTETLKFNGDVIPLPVTKFSVPPSGVSQKQLRVKGLAVKAGIQFPIGQYQIEVYSEGQLVQQGVFEVREPASTGLWFTNSFSHQLVAWSGAEHTQLDPDIFIVTEEEIEIVPEETDYYDAEEFRATYDQLEHVDELFEPFPDDVLEAIEDDALLEAEASCAAIGGVFEATSSQCFVDDYPELVCRILGGIYDTTTDQCSFGESDSDNDGWFDSFDNCPFIANVDQSDANGDGLGDACNSDSGGEDDSDGDGWLDSEDNCLFIANANQSDADGNGVGDVCDSDSGGGDDTDDDGWPDDQDNCPFIANANQSDADGDGVGDVCDSDGGGGNDADGDGWTDDQDNCPFIANANQSDADGDGVGDACDSNSGGGNDTDGDGWSDDQDNCPTDFNSGQEDSDSDGVGDACDSDSGGGNDTDGDGWPDDQDNCPTDFNSGQEDSDSDGVGDVCDSGGGTDTDGDGWVDDQDNCPTVSNPGQEDSDSDGVGDVCDSTLALSVTSAWMYGGLPVKNRFAQSGQMY